MAQVHQIAETAHALCCKQCGRPTGGYDQRYVEYCVMRSHVTEEFEGHVRESQSIREDAGIFCSPNHLLDYLKAQDARTRLGDNAPEGQPDADA